MKASVDNIRKDVPRGGQRVVVLAWNRSTKMQPAHRQLRTIASVPIGAD